MDFSKRIPSDLTPNDLSTALDAGKGAYLDLTISNPLKVGLPFPALSPLPASLTYEPSAQGLLSARVAVSNDFQRQGLQLPPEDIFLTAGTSEAYSLIFTLMADPGGTVYSPSPGYPLIEHLARADGLQTDFYPLDLNEMGGILKSGLKWTSGMKVCVAINPHNPTGQYLSGHDFAYLEDECSRQGAALILDEVFWDYGWEEPVWRPKSETRSLTFHLGGLSKSCGLPQMKCSWMGLRGPKKLVEEAKQRLDFLADQYLSVSTPIQQALPDLLQSGTSNRKMIIERLHMNLEHIRKTLKPHTETVRFMPGGGGWSAVIRVLKPVSDDESSAIELIRRGVWMMPGMFFDYPENGYWVISLLTPPEDLKKGLAIALEFWTHPR